MIKFEEKLLHRIIFYDKIQKIKVKNKIKDNKNSIISNRELYKKLRVKEEKTIFYHFNSCKAEIKVSFVVNLALKDNKESN